MQARLIYGGGGEIHLTASGSAGTKVYDAGEILAPAAVDGNVCGVVSGSSPIYGGERFAVYTSGVYEINTDSSTTFSKGAAVEWDASSKEAKASGTFGIGGAVDAKINGQTKTVVNLNEFGEGGS